MNLSINSNITENIENQTFESLAIKLPFNADRSIQRNKIFNTSITTEEQSISNFINLLLTRSGERYLQPDFGIGIDLFLFEPFSKQLVFDIRNRINSQTRLWLPYINIDRVEINENENHKVFIEIYYRVGENGVNRQVTFRSSDEEISIEVN